VSRDEDGGQRLALFGRARRVCAAPRQQLEEQLVVAPVGKVDRFAALDGRGLARELGRVFALLDDDAALLTGADVVSPAVLEAREQLLRRGEREGCACARAGRATRG
jgi:hypothetical protein